MFLPNFATLRNVIAAEIWLLARPHELALNHMDYIAAARHAIPDLGSEDYYHLADGTAYLPTVPAEHRHTVAREAMLQLVEQGVRRTLLWRASDERYDTCPARPGARGSE
jgi:hypothetical protein